MVINLKKIAGVSLIMLSFLISCAPPIKVPNDIETIVKHSGNSVQLEKVIENYSSPADSLQLKAAYYLIKNMSRQFHYEGNTVDQFDKMSGQIDSLTRLAQRRLDYLIDSANQVNPIFDARSVRNGYKRKVLDSLQKVIGFWDRAKMEKVEDIKMITADILIENIDFAFKAWKYPWCKHLTFAQFCECILPYKILNEAPSHWRKELNNKFEWIKNEMHDSTDAKEACLLINGYLKNDFYLEGSYFKYPLDLSYDELKLLKMGKCSDANHYAAYAMRAMGVPVAYDYTPLWANKNKGHDWLVLLNNYPNQSFVGCESDPGLDKICFAGRRYMARRCAKIFRHSYTEVPLDTSLVSDDADIPSLFSNGSYWDVTNLYLPVSNINVPITGELSDTNVAYLCIFNDNKWRAISYSSISRGTRNICQFNNIGRDIAYTVMTYANEIYTPVSPVFIVTKEGQIRYLEDQSRKKQDITLFMKYPEDATNKIKPKNEYELFYWNNNWVSIGKQTASADSLCYTKVPFNALFILRSTKGGTQDRIFTIENKKQKWW